jgi:hypothetical protein
MEHLFPPARLMTYALVVRAGDWVTMPYLNPFVMQRIVNLLITAACLYLLAGFISWNFNVSTWGNFGRFMLVVASLCAWTAIEAFNESMNKK